MVSDAVVAAGGEKVQHAVEPGQLLFDRLGDGFFEVLRIAAEIIGGDLHHRRHHFGIGRDRQRRNGDAPRMTITIAITIAKTGWSIKNRAMMLLP